ncbi:MAG TPA: L,D-transpeptidase [Clostridia bacterium]|nr:L,D-transpeptidase [Clostridia bacterium]
MYYCPFMRNPEYYRVSYSITVNIKERRLHLIKDGKWFKSYPIAVGKILTQTPTGTYKIINKQLNPGGPFGARWMGLNRKGYGIHGTNNPSSIGKAVSHGCIRMYNKDVIELFNLVGVGARVKIV